MEWKEARTNAYSYEPLFFVDFSSGEIVSIWDGVSARICGYSTPAQAAFDVRYFHPDTRVPLIEGPLEQ